ncbi:DMT family transporter [Sinanaerobacter chloroacetimidivorans]|uniref:DMT family transporter n=1 Tax=Sinanaerobacter chloroacetimidivorans TaxID=2818044 RepID=A0A8J7W3I3_9FIRM|nr:DMT family transporter [Sinanaerobacter chloroacetimidivorans]MBR0600212.1 DMT family transporter [Sinanaerobacter chloroacetimidivorans]
MTTNRIYILMVCSAMFWSGAFIAGKYSVPYIPTFTLTFLRFFIAVIILYFVMKRQKETYQFEIGHLPVYLFTGLVGMFGYHVLFFTALKSTTAINSSIIAAANPMVTVLMAFLFLKQKLKIKQLAGILLSFSGVLLTITGADLSLLKDFSFNKGDLWMLGAVSAWAAYSVFSKSKGKEIPSLAMTFYSFVVCTAALIPFVLYEKPWTFLLSVPLSAYGAVIYMSIFPSVIGYLVQQMAIKEIGPGKTSIFINLVPVFSILLAVMLLGEVLQPVKLLTAALIILGVFICQRDSIDN